MERNVNSGSITLSRRQLVEVMLSSSSSFEEKFKILLNHVRELINCPEDLLYGVKQKLYYAILEFKVKWQSARRIKERFLKQNKNWLDTVITLPFYPQLSSSSSTSGGRPSVVFSKCSERSKRRKVDSLRSTSTAELVYAAQMNLRAEGNVDAAAVVKDSIFTTPTRARKIRMAYQRSNNEVVRLSGDEALSVLVEAQLTKHQYKIIQEQDKKRFPPYGKVLEAKKRCYPKPEFITVTGRSAEVKLQAILDHTVDCIRNMQNDVILSLTTEQLNSLLLISKWGCDGSSGHSQYKQVFENDGDSDSSIFVTSFVPLQLISDEPNSSKKIIVWQNPRPASPRFCRPVRLQFIQETSDIITQEKLYIETQINELRPSCININNTEISIKHHLKFTMIHGKICNAASFNRSTQTCYICGFTSKFFNNVDGCLK